LKAGNKHFDGGLESDFSKESIAEIKDAGLRDHITKNANSGKNINELTEEYQANTKSTADAKSNADYDNAQTLFNSHFQKQRDDKSAADAAAAEQAAKTADFEKARKEYELKQKVDKEKLGQYNSKMAGGDLQGVNSDWKNNPTFDKLENAEQYFNQEKDSGIGNLLKRAIPGGDTGTSSMYDRDVTNQGKARANRAESKYQSSNEKQLTMLNDPKMKDMKPFAKNINFLNKKFNGDANKLLEAIEGGHGGNFTSLIEDMGPEGINSLTSEVASKELGMDADAFENFKKVASMLLEKRGHYNG